MSSSLCLVTLKTFSIEKNSIAVFLNWNRLYFTFECMSKRCSAVEMRFVHKTNDSRMIRALFAAIWLFFECIFQFYSMHFNRNPRGGAGFLPKLKRDHFLVSVTRCSCSSKILFLCTRMTLPILRFFRHTTPGGKFLNYLPGNSWNKIKWVPAVAKRKRWLTTWFQIWRFSL